MKRIAVILFTVVLLLCSCDSDNNEINNTDIFVTDENITTTASNDESTIETTSSTKQEIVVSRFNKVEDEVSDKVLYESDGQIKGDFDMTLLDETSKDNLDRIIEAAAKYKKEGNLTFSFYSIDSGCSLDFYSDNYYDTCSVIKAPFSKFLLQNEVDLTEEIPCINYIGGSGILKKSDVGKNFSVETYIKDAIVYSDNCAYMTLLEHFGRSDFTAYLKDIGVVNTRLNGCNFGFMSSKDAVIAFNDIYKSRNDQYGEFLFECMENTEYNDLITGAGLPYTIAHKFGDDEIRICLHDVAIVFSDHPYILAIFSKYNENIDSEYEKAINAFHDLTNLIDTFNNGMYYIE